MARQALGVRARSSPHDHSVDSALAEQRREIARDVHDGIAQELAFIAVQLRQLDRTSGDGDLVRELQAASRRALLEARLTIDVLRAPGEVSFAWLVEQAVRSFEARSGVAIELRLELDGCPPPDRERRTAVLRILGQALANAAEHGAARRVRVSLRAGPAGLSLRVSDDGAGFVPAAVGARPRGWGIVSMRERAELLGGSFTIDAAPGEGTEVAVVLP